MADGFADILAVFRQRHRLAFEAGHQEAGGGENGRGPPSSRYARPLRQVTNIAKIPKKVAALASKIPRTMSHGVFLDSRTFDYPERVGMRF